MPLSHICVAVFVTILWGVNFSFVKLGLGEFPPLLLSALRFCLAALPALFFAWPKKHWRLIIAYGVTQGVLQFGLLFSAMDLGISASLASVVLQCQAIFTLIFAVLLSNERIARHNVGAMVFAIFGLGLIGIESIGELGALPYLLLIAAAASWGISNIIIKKSSDVDIMPFIAYSSLIPPLPLFGLSVLIDGTDTIVDAMLSINLAGLASLLYLSFVSTTLGFGLWGWLLKRYNATLIAPFSLLVPIFGILSGVIFYQETMSHYAIAGTAILIIGLVINLGLLRRIFAPKTH